MVGESAGCTTFCSSAGYCGSTQAYRHLDCTQAVAAKQYADTIVCNSRLRHPHCPATTSGGAGLPPWTLADSFRSITQATYSWDRDVDKTPICRAELEAASVRVLLHYCTRYCTTHNVWSIIAHHHPDVRSILVPPLPLRVSQVAAMKEWRRVTPRVPSDQAVATAVTPRAECQLQFPPFSSFSAASNLITHKCRDLFWLAVGCRLFSPS